VCRAAVPRHVYAFGDDLDFNFTKVHSMRLSIARYARHPVIESHPAQTGKTNEESTVGSISVVPILQHLPMVGELSTR
jgi:hypothetical protein